MYIKLTSATIGGTVQSRDNDSLLGLRNVLIARPRSAFTVLPSPPVHFNSFPKKVQRNNCHLVIAQY